MYLSKIIQATPLISSLSDLLKIIPNRIVGRLSRQDDLFLYRIAGIPTSGHGDGSSRSLIGSLSAVLDVTFYRTSHGLKAGLGSDGAFRYAVKLPASNSGRIFR